MGNTREKEYHSTTPGGRVSVHLAEVLIYCSPDLILNDLEWPAVTAVVNYYSKVCYFCFCGICLTHVLLCMSKIRGGANKELKTQWRSRNKDMSAWQAESISRRRIEEVEQQEDKERRTSGPSHPADQPQSKEESKICRMKKDKAQREKAEGLLLTDEMLSNCCIWISWDSDILFSVTFFSFSSISSFIW